MLLTKFKKIIGMKEKYEGTSFTYGIFTPNPRELWWIFLFDILHFTMVFRGIALLKLFHLI